MAKCEHTEHAERVGERVGRHWSDRDQKDYWVPCDTDMGDYVYCHSHVNAHATGWCSVGHGDKVPLKATNWDDAMAEARALGLRIHWDDA